VRQGAAIYIPPHRSKDQGIHVRAGDSITVETPGGGGCGDARQRDPDLIARDVARGYYTREQAKALFSGG
jgi:N-methylhydantoinase B